MDIAEEVDEYTSCASAFSSALASRTRIWNRSCVLEMRRFYQGHKQVLGVIRYYEAMKINEKHDLQSKDRT